MTKPMDKLLRDALSGSASTPPRTPCLDADTVAALADGTLAARERAAAEAHAAECLRCQAVLAAMVRTMPPVAPRVWWRRPAFMWLAPLTAAAAALVVWSNVPRTAIVAPDSQPAAMRAPQPAPDVAAAAKPREVAGGRATIPAAPLADASPAPTRNRAAAQRSEPQAAQQQARGQRAGAPATPGEPAAAEDRLAAAPQLVVPAPPAAAAPPVPPSAATTAEASAKVAAAAEQAQRSDAAGANAASADGARQLMARRFVAKETTIVSADSQSRWRLGSLGGFVEHSTDGGATWQVLPTGVNAMLVDGSSPSRSVCWLVGQGGVVILTTDEGRSWQRLTLTASVDLRSVNATSDKNATVVAADGRRFTTSDGGRTWRP